MVVGGTEDELTYEWIKLSIWMSVSGDANPIIFGCLNVAPFGWISSQEDAEAIISNLYLHHHGIEMQREVMMTGM